MSSLRPPRGAHDILPDQMRRHQKVEEGARDVAAFYGFEEMATPVFEFAEVFSRTLGDTSDIVTKEMYCFEDKGGETLTLRPENTAGIARAFISEGLAQSLPLKVFYRGPMFRYERPQKGRQRQFHQVGVEFLGPDDPLADVEVIALGAQVLEALGVSGQAVLEINTLGDTQSRLAYRDKLVDYLEKHQDALSKDSQERLKRNPLRILDSKDEKDREIITDAPLIETSLNDASKSFFDRVQTGLTDVGVDFQVNPHLVRGLDYYCHTAFEFTTEALGAQGALIAGGRYDGLIAQMGGPATPGVGWAAGVERLAMLIDEPPISLRPVVVVPVDKDMVHPAFVLTQRLRAAKIAADMGYSGNMAKRMKRANRSNAWACVILGPDELAKDVVTVRDMNSGEQEEVPMASLENYLLGKRNKP
jgi:histidyl-tRNA synthetase